MVINPSHSDESKALLVDIGGTNVRTCKAYLNEKKLLEPAKKGTSCLKNFDELIQSFLDNDPGISHLVISVAGPKLNNSISMTNRNFFIDEKDLSKKYNLDSAFILNDWESIGHSLHLFSQDEISFINQGNAFNGTALMVGPGTGLGAALVVDESIVLPTEVGNTSSFLHNLLQELDIKNFDEFNVIEDLISGGGIEKLHNYLNARNLSSEEIINLCKDSNSDARKTIDTFLNAIAIVLSEFALTYMPGSGIYLAGGLMRSLNEFIDTNTFMQAFIASRKPMHAEVLKEIPLGVINAEMTCLHGNLAYLKQKLEGQ